MIPARRHLTPGGGIAGTYADNVGSRLFRHFATVKQIESYAWPSADWFEYSSLEEDCRQFRDLRLRAGVGSDTQPCF